MDLLEEWVLDVNIYCRHVGNVIDTAASGGRVGKLDCNFQRRRLRLRSVTRQVFFNVNNINFILE